MPAVGRGEHGQRDGALVRHDRPRGRAHRLDPPVAVEPALLVPTDVDLVVRAVGQMAVARRLQAVLPDLVEREAPSRDRLRPQRLGGPAARHLADPQQVLLEREPRDQSERTVLRARRQVELERAAVVRRTALGHRDARSVIGIRGEQVGRRAAPGLPAHHGAVGVVHLVRAVHGPDDPRLTVGDLAHRRAADRSLHGKAHGSGLRRQMQRVLGRRQRDADVTGRVGDLRDLGAAVEVGEDLRRRPAVARQPVRAPLGEAETVPPAAAVEREGIARAGGGRGQDGRRYGDDEREETYASHGKGCSVGSGTVPCRSRSNRHLLRDRLGARRHASAVQVGAVRDP